MSIFLHSELFITIYCRKKNNYNLSVVKRIEVGPTKVYLIVQYSTIQYKEGTISGEGYILLVLHFRRIESVTDLGKLVWLSPPVNRMQLCLFAGIV